MADSIGEEVVQVSLSEETPQVSDKGLSGGRVLVKTPDLKFRKQGKGGTQVFAPGTSSMGRVKGSKNKMTALAAQMIGDRAEDVIKMIIDKALDPADKDQAMMLKLLIERIAPASRAVDITATNREEKTITISVQGINIHEGILGDEPEQDIEEVEFTEQQEEETDDGT